MTTQILEEREEVNGWKGIKIVVMRCQSRHSKYEVGRSEWEREAGTMDG